jgi:sulfate adenylyltransferase subunit 1
MDNLRFVMVGHVDHGKSTLIGRLLYDTESLPPDKLEEIKIASEEQGKDVEFAYVMDHLEEERSRSITIDTAQTFFRTPEREYVIIDAPGHKEFLKNMITGASQAEAAVLIVDAAEGVREQTQRHAFMIDMLGLEQLIVVVNKMDSIDFSEEKFDEVKKNIIEFLAKVNLRPNYVIPISAKKGDNVSNRSKNMDWYEGVTFLEALISFVNLPSALAKPMRFPVQLIHEVGGEKVVMGRVEAGILEKGREIIILPAGNKALVENIMEYERDGKNSAEAGESTGIVLSGSEVPPERGDVINYPGEEPPVTDRFKASVFWMSPIPFSIDEDILLRIATGEVTCKVEEITERINSSTLEVLEENASVLNNTEAGEVIIRTISPVVVESFYKTKELGRFVLVRGNDVVAGGIIAHAVGNTD